MRRTGKIWIYGKYEKKCMRRFENDKIIVDWIDGRNILQKRYCFSNYLTTGIKNKKSVS